MMILFNDQIIPKDQVTISFEDRGYTFGDGVYEVFRLYRGIPFCREAHMHRLKRSLMETRIQLPYPMEKLEHYLDQLITTAPQQDGLLYLQISRGSAPRSHAFPPAAVPVVLAYCQPLPRPVQAMRSGISAITQPDLRWLRCDIKSLNLLPNVMAKQNALDHGADDAILVRNGTVTECTAANIMAIRNSIIYTHPANHLILHGITRNVVLKLAKEINREVREEAFSSKFLARADEVFITGTTTEITPVTTIDQKPVGNGRPGPITRQLQAAFEVEAGLE
ncbi:D-amino-acid transaminase [Paenibacillus senegalensis]|uniref:D-amino-acid transaminase n=1 Tax=Paenibacillus senegalensis TaxID=1465766 RepID=UPI0002891627|nr:D-amino-acid transaminase [Paenibacillus senegalensis]